MMAELLTTEGVHRNRQYESWRDAVSSTHHAWSMPSRPRSAYHGRVARRPLGMGAVLVCECDPCTGERGRSELSGTDEDLTGVLFVLEGRERLTHPEGDAFVPAGSFTLWSTTRPLAFEVPARLRKLTLLLPTELVAHRLGGADRRGVYDARTGCGAVLLAQLRAVAGLPDGLDPTSQDAALRSAVDLLAAAIGAQSDVRCSRLDRLVARAEVHVRRHLHDPELTVERTAQALGVSRRQLDRAFAARGTSVGRFIWSERLERCRRDVLLDRGASMSEIAFRWGFSDAAHFSRAFRASFGTSPTRYRADGGG